MNTQPDNPQIPIDPETANLVTYQTYEWNKGIKLAKDYKEYYTSDITQNEQIIQEITQSVNMHKGYFISRYEAGTTIKRTSKVETNSEQLPKPVFKATTSEAPIYAFNWINWDDALYISNNLYNKQDDNVTSRMVSARSWDTALKFIQDEDDIYPENSSNKGWYVDNKSNNSNLEIGKSVDITNETIPNKLKNIYDMGGNMYEWTADVLVNSNQNRADRRW